jgi:hypothetical protein
VQLEGLGQLKNPITSLGIKPMTFWLVGYCRNQPGYRIPRDYGKDTFYVSSDIKLTFKIAKIEV